MKKPRTLLKLYSLVLKQMSMPMDASLGNGVCIYIAVLVEEKKISNQEREILETHFFKQRTLAIHEFGANEHAGWWWPIRNLEPRIKFIKYIISTLKPIKT